MPPIYVVDLLVQGRVGQLTVGNPVVEYGVSAANRVEDVLGFIRIIGERTTYVESSAVMPLQGSQIIRATTDEFSFYPQGAPFTIEEYKLIIKGSAEIASKLPPDCHLVLATFPVLWPDGGIHNCGLYVQSPNAPGTSPVLHHFSKKNPFHLDFRYKKFDDTFYPLTTDIDCTEEQDPNIVLSDTEIAINDINQYGAAIKLTTSQEDTFISTIGICKDHDEGVEKKEVQKLILQLQKHHQSIPLHCSHVITSASVYNVPDNTLSTLSHADVNPAIRQPALMNAWLSLSAPPLPECITELFYNPFSKSYATVEEYPAKFIGTIHSDLFLQAFVCDHSRDENWLNIPDEYGNTELHRVLLEENPDPRLTAKRLYAMILMGGDPNVPDGNGLTLMGLLDTIDDRYKIVQLYIEKAIERTKLPYNKPLNDLAPILSPVWDAATPGYTSTLVYFIEQGGNPYRKDGHGMSALDFVERYPPIECVLMQYQLQHTFKQFHSYSCIEERETILDSPWMPHHFWDYMKTLPHENRRVLLDNCLASLMEAQDEEILKFYVHCLNYELPELLRSFKDFTFLLSKFTDPAMRSSLFTIMQNKLATFTDVPSQELNALLSVGQLKWIRTTYGLGDEAATLSTEWDFIASITDACDALWKEMDHLVTMLHRRSDMNQFMDETQELIKFSIDADVLTGLQMDLLATVDILRSEYAPEMIKNMTINDKKQEDSMPNADKTIDAFKSLKDKFREHNQDVGHSQATKKSGPK